MHPIKKAHVDFESAWKKMFGESKFTEMIRQTLNQDQKAHLCGLFYENGFSIDVLDLVSCYAEN